MLFSQLLTMSMDDKYEFQALRGDWGNTNSAKYNDMLARFCRNIRELAKNCPVKYFAFAFYIFDGRIYQVVDVSIVEQAYQLLLEKLCVAPVMNRTSLRKEIFIATIKNYNTLVPQFDIVAFRNGVVDFTLSRKTKPEAMPFSPHYHVTYYHPYDFDPKAKCPLWNRFLMDVLPDKDSRDILQMFLGLGLVQRGDAFNVYDGKVVNKIELCLMMIGSGANGKSVIFEVMCALFGPDRISKMDYADLTADGDEGMRGRYPIRNAIFNWSSDSDVRKFGKKNTGMFKRLVSGEPITYRKLGEDVFESRSVPYLIFSLNSEPESNDTSLGMIRRLQYVNFEVTVPKEKQDPELASKIINKELSGVFNWLLEGERKLRERHFRFPEAEGSKKHRIMAYLKSQPVLSWLMAYDIKHQRRVSNEIGLRIPVSLLYESFVQFCNDNNLDDNDIPSSNKFSRVLWDDCHFVKKKTPKCIAYDVYGVTEADLRQHFIISELTGKDYGEEVGFIKEDVK